ncbi:non-ribosomal peptide synthetase [Lysobacter enzymogenes]|uniref:non-ribosomal peptide synthetase n=1 Tax=Lysobacter enzymogenes TaxID=69 RepID=UPI0011170482|nr:non-ribosomal peptide synthetase [Lysobacter enzymogenes]UZW58366.1 non-ribosomal peptide synthetase [Lysobacter enzymogenes]
MKGVEDIYPLSPMQQGMLFHSLYAPNTGAYIEQITCAFEGDLDLDAFAQAWRHVLARHPILRTAFLWEGLDEPVQVVRADAEAVHAYEDWQDLPEQARRQHRDAWLERDRRRGFDIARAPLTRYLLAKTAADRYEFVWTFHHLILDGWSIPLVLRDFFLAYQAICAGAAPPAAGPRPFRDYIEWLQQQPQPEAMEFWRRTLGGFAAPTPLGVDLRPGDAQDEVAYAEASFRFATRTTARLQAFSRQQQVTLSTLALGAWALLLGRYGGHDDVVVGATVSGRSPQLADANAMVGMFVNTLPVRARIDAARPVADWLRELQAQTVEARQYEHSPLVQVHGWSWVPRGLPLFESIVAFQNQPIAEVLRSVEFGLKVHSLVAHHTRTTYPLTLVVEPGEQLALVMVYDARRFEPEALERLAAHLEALLDDIAGDASRPLGELSILPEAERERLLHEFNRVPAAAPVAPPCLHHQFERQAAAEPERIALCAGAQRLSYGELNARANRLAHHLRALGVGPETVVALCLERSAEMVVAMLAVLKAGGAYLPLDPQYPRERLEHMLRDSAAAVLLTHSELAGRLDAGAAARVLIDADRAAIDAHGADDPPASAGPDHLMYVIYTSGSSGSPKGSLLTHGNAARLFEAAQDLYRFDRSDVWTLFHSYAFDFSVWELWGALRCGARLVLVPAAAAQSPRELHALLIEQGVTVLNLTPSVFLPFLDVAVRSAEPLPLRLVVFGGEALDLAALKPWFERFGDERPRLVNMYGITETTVHVTYRPLAAAEPPGRARSPIGVPLADLQTYVLDARLQPVAVGVPGELYVGGAGLARGYLNRPGLTAERFLPNPLSGRPGDRLYRTGDRARFVGDLEMEYLGRLDHQLKIRGFRIEAGEVEAALRALPQVRDAAVVAYEEGPGDRRLIAHIVLDAGAELRAGELRGALGERLPGYMIPARFVVAEALPITANGKVDRAALPAPDGARPELAREYVAPRNELEQELAQIWGEVLGTERVGVHDDFFELGGHSLLATRLISRVRDTYQVDLPLRRLFEVTTIDALAIAILQSRTEETGEAALEEIFAELESLGAQAHER